MMPLNRRIDHTVLKPDATASDVLKACEEARRYGFASVCVNPVYVRLVHHALEESGVKTCTVIGFPLGTSCVKPLEANRAVSDGADELDMVIQIGALKQKDYRAVQMDIRAVVEAAQHALVKVIIETCLLTDEEKRIACEMAVDAGADFVKTSTGFSTGGATVQDIALMRRTVGPDIGVKASGGIRSCDDALRMIEAGASRIGTSSGVAIVEQSSQW